MSAMTREEATQIVLDTPDDADLGADVLGDVFEALHGRRPDDNDRAEGLWSHCCAAATE